MTVFVPGPQPPDFQPPAPGEGGGGGPVIPGLPIQLLPTPSIPAVMPGQSFTDTVGNALGVLGTPADGFDSLFAVPASAFPLDTASLADLDAAMAAADFIEGVFDSGNIAPLFEEIAAFQAGGDLFFGGTNPNVGQATANVSAAAQSLANQHYAPPDVNPAPPSA